MTMLTDVACLLVALAPAPQSPPAGAQAAIPFASTLPNDTLAVISVSPLTDRFDALRATGLGKVVAKFGETPDIGAAMAMAEVQLTSLTGLDRETAMQVLGGGACLAVTGVDRAGQPEVIICMQVGRNGNPVIDALKKGGMQLKHGPNHSTGTATWILDPDSATPGALALHRGALILCSDAEVLDETITRRARGTSSLADNRRYAEFATKVMAKGTPLVCAYAQPAEVLARILPSLPAESVDQVRAVFDALALHRLDLFGYAAHVKDDEIHDLIRIGFPEPRVGLLAALIPQTPVSPDVATMIPPNVSAFSVSHTNLGDLFNEAVGVVESIEPRARQMVTAMLQQMRSRTGIDLEHDILRAVGPEIVTLQWSGDDGADTAIIASSSDGSRVGASFQRLAGSLGVQPKVLEIDGAEAFSIGGLPGNSSAIDELNLAFTSEHVVIATSGRALRATLSQLSVPRTNDSAVAFLSSLPRGATGASWTDINALTETLASSMDEQMRRARLETGISIPGGMDSARELLASLEGAMRMVVQTDTRGLEVSTSSPYGNVMAVGVVAVGAAALIPNVVDRAPSARPAPPVTTTVGPRMVAPDADLVGLIGRIAVAEEELRKRDLPFGSIDDLVSGGLLRPEDAGTPAAGGAHRHRHFLVRVLLPDDPEMRREHYVVTAWPEGERRGSVLAATSPRNVMRNDVIAATAGMRIVEPADLFLDGRFGTEIVPGWRSVAIQDISAGRDRELFEAVLAAEKAGDPDVGNDVISALRSPNPVVAARAAFALGRIGSRKAVKALCEAAERHPALDVRRHAMSALNKIADGGSAEAAARVLQADDVMLRAMAASLLGSLRSGEATEALVGVATREHEPNEKDARDRTAAILALADIGTPASLLPVAASVDSETDKDLCTALAFLFQQTSTMLERDDEAQLLMAVLDHPSTLLRRFSLQRLAELKVAASQKTLENRLATEPDPALIPLVEVALKSLNSGSPEGGGEVTAFAAKVSDAWKKLTPEQRGYVAGGGLGALVVIGSLLFLRQRRRRRAMAEQWASMTAPSDDYEYEGDGDDDAAFQGDYDAEGEDYDAEGEDYDAEYDADEEWDEDGEQDWDEHAEAGATDGGGLFDR